MKKNPHPTLLGSLLALMIGSWALNFIFGKIGLRHMPAMTLASFRVVLAGAIMLPVYLALRPAEHASSRPEFWTFVQLGFLGVVVNQVCFTVGLNYTTVGHSAVIMGTGPITIMLLAWLQGQESLTRKKVLGMALSFSGVTVLAAEHGLNIHSGTLVGDLITLTGSLAFSLYTVNSKKVAARYDSLSMNAYNYFVGAILVLPLAAYQGLRLTRGDGWRTIGWQGWTALAFMALFASVIAYIAHFYILRYMSASRLGAFSYLLPVVSTLLGIVVLREKATWSLLLGGGLVLSGVYLIESGEKRSAP